MNNLTKEAIEEYGKQKNDSKYIDAFNASVAELSKLMAKREELDQERETLDQRIFKLRAAAIGLGGLCGQTGISSRWPELFPDRIPPDTGLTDAIRQVFSANSEFYLSPVRIRDFLKEMSYDMSSLKNPLASIHTVIKRLKLQGELDDNMTEGRNVYKWKKKEDGDDVPF